MFKEEAEWEWRGIFPLLALPSLLYGHPLAMGGPDTNSKFDCVRFVCASRYLVSILCYWNSRPLGVLCLTVLTRDGVMTETNRVLLLGMERKFCQPLFFHWPSLSNEICAYYCLLCMRVCVCVFCSSGVVTVRGNLILSRLSDSK